MFKQIFLASLIGFNLYACNHENAAAMQEYYVMLLERATRQQQRHEQEKKLTQALLQVAPTKELIEMAQAEQEIALKMERYLSETIRELTAKISHS